MRNASRDPGEHWLPSKYGAEDAQADVTEAAGEAAQHAYVADRKAEAERAYADIARAFEESVSRARLNYLGEQRERLKQCLYDDDFPEVARRAREEALSLHMVPFSRL